MHTTTPPSRALLQPKLISTLRGYTREQFAGDAIAGVIVGIVALPLAIAFAIASGVSPERGIYTAIIGGALISLLGGSRVQIGGPTGAFVVIVYGIVHQYGVDGLLVATLMAGVLLVAMGLAGLGSAIKFISYPVIVGFTSGIALLIFSSQVKDVFGLEMGAVPAEFLEKWGAFATAFPTLNPWALAVGAGSLLLIVAWRRVSEKVPGALVALVAATAIVRLWELPVETIGSRFGAMPHGLPAPMLPAITWDRIQLLFPTAVTIALLGGIEALLSAVVSDGMIGGRHRSNMELVAQGLANIASPLFGGMPATGAIARTATNVNNGGRTPVAGVIHALVLLLILLAFGRWAEMIPLACLAAILIYVAYNMSEWHAFAALLRAPRSDIAVLLVTFALTVLVDLTVAIQAGVLLSVFLFLRQMADVTNVRTWTRSLQDTEEAANDPESVATHAVPHGVEVFEVYGPLFFGAVSQFHETMAAVAHRSPKVRILQMRHVPAIDATGLRALAEEHRQCARRGTALILSGVQPQPRLVLARAGMLDAIGPTNLVAHLDAALERARALLGP